MGMFLTCFYPSGLVPVLRCWDLHLSTFGCNWDVERRGTRTQMAQKMVGLCEVGELVYVDLAFEQDGNRPCEKAFDGLDAWIVEFSMISMTVRRWLDI